MPKITPEDYPQLKAFCAFWQTRMFAGTSVVIPPDCMPVALVQALEAKSMAKARLSLGMFVGDVIEMTSHLPRAEVAEIDADLAERGIITLSVVRARYSRKLHGIIKRGEIRNEAEFHLVAGVVSSGLGEVSAVEIQQLQGMIHAFEVSVSAGKS